MLLRGRRFAMERTKNGRKRLSVVELNNDIMLLER